MPFLERRLYTNNITNFLNFRTMENVERIYCCDRGDNDNALTAAIMANNNRRDDLGPMLAMNGGMNSWMNNPFAYMMMMAWMRNFNGDYNNGQGTAIQGQLDAIRNQLNDNQNANLLRDAIGDGFNRNDFALSQLAQNLNVDFNTLQKSCCDVQAAIQQVAGQIGFSAERVINAVNLGDCNVIQALQNCCCQTQRQIADFRADVQLQGCKNTSELLRGQDFINRSVERGFSSVAFQAQQDKCDIIRAGQDNTQRIIDTLNGHWSDEKSLQIQDLKFQLSQERQNNLLLNRLGGNGCGCGNSYGCGCGQ